MIRVAQGDPEFFCRKCNRRLTVEDYGNDYTVEPCSCEFDHGWNECLAHNSFFFSATIRRIRNKLSNNMPWIAVGYGAALLFCFGCWYALYVMLAPMF